MSLKLPNTADVIEILEMMIGESPRLAAGDGVDLAAPPAGTSVSWLATDDGEVLGAIVATLPVAVFLGGTMIMIPAGAQEDQVNAGAASEAVVDAMSEINNMLRGLLNTFRMNTHVSPSKLADFAPPAADDANAWVLNPAQRLDLSGRFPCGTGCMTLLSRDAG